MTIPAGARTACDAFDFMTDCPCRIRRRLTPTENPVKYRIDAQPFDMRDRHHHPSLFAMRFADDWSSRRDCFNTRNVLSY